MTETVTLDIKALDHASAVLGNVGKKLDGFAQTAGQKVSALGATLAKTGGLMTAGLTTPLAAAGIAMVGMASDMAETGSKIQQLFGESSASIQAWSDDAAKSFGQSKQQALDASATFAIFGKAAGLTGEELVTFSTGFTELASDLASFNNTSPEQAIQAIGAALRGESEPLRAYGVLLDDASMRQKALELGIVATTKEALTPQQKVLAAQALIYEQTTAAQGDFARTSDGLANKQRILKAQFVDMGTELGEKLLPIALKVVTWVGDLMDKFDGLSPQMQNIILVVGGVVAALGPVITIIGGLFSAIGPIIGLIGGAGGFTAILGGLGTALTALTGPVGLIIAAVGALAFAWTRDWGGIRTKTMEFLGSIGPTLKSWGESIKTWWSDTRDKVTEVMGSLGERTGKWRESMAANLSGLADYWRTWKETIASWGQWLWDKLSTMDWGQLGSNIIKGIVDGIILSPWTIADAVESAANEAVERLKQKLGIQSPSKVMAEEVGFPMAQGIAQGLQRGMPEAMRQATTNNYFNLSLVGATGQLGNDMRSTVQLLGALYG